MGFKDIGRDEVVRREDGFRGLSTIFWEMYIFRGLVGEEELVKRD